MKFCKILFLLICCSLPLLVCGMECEACHRRIEGEYFQVSGRNYCSRECFWDTLPKCEVCDNPCQQKYTVQGRDFCSKECLYQVFKCAVCQTGLEEIYTVSNDFGQQKMCCRRCRSLPQCYYCAMPDNRPALADGRRICRDCRGSAVTDRREVQRIFNQLRRELSRLYGYDKNHRIELHIVDLRELRRATSDGQHLSGNQLGLMRYNKRESVRNLPGGRQEREVVDEQCHIYILHTMPRALLINALVHELTHDYIRHHVGEVQDKTSEEGFCELIASLYNARIGNAFLNRAKEVSKDPVYGGGFRQMRGIYRRNNRSFQRTLRYVR